jgi:hypothetical protein
MAYIRRWVGGIFALVVTVLLSACGSQEVKFDHHINTPVLSTLQPGNVSLQQDPFSLEEFAANSQLQGDEDQHTERLIKYVASRFKKPEVLIEKIVLTAKKYAQPGFPTVDDIIAIIAVESTFNTNAHYRGSWGLMQIEAKSHRNKAAGERLTSIDTNIRIGTSVLTEYYETTHSVSGAITAYNVGIGSYLKGKRNHKYLSKVEKEKAILADL